MSSCGQLDIREDENAEGKLLFSCPLCFSCKRAPAAPACVCVCEIQLFSSEHVCEDVREDASDGLLAQLRPSPLAGPLSLALTEPERERKCAKKRERKSGGEAEDVCGTLEDASRE